MVARDLSRADGPALALSKWRLVEASKLARVELGAVALQDSKGLDSDPQVLADRPLIEGVGLARQLDLAVERLVRDAQQGPVRHPEAIALGRDRRRFHVDRNRPRLVEAKRRQCVAQ